MNDSPLASTWQRSPTRRVWAWLASWRGIRKVLIVLAWSATVVALIYAEENWRGRRAWNKYRQELEARGVPIELKALLPKRVPDDENFAATPVIQSWFKKVADPETNDRWNDEYSKVASKVTSFKARPEPPQKGTRRLTDLTAWAAALEAHRSGKTNVDESGPDRADREARARAARVVLDGLKSSEAILAELRAASSRPAAVYPVNYALEDPWAIPLPHLQNVKAACQRLHLKALAELALGEREKALDDVRLIFYLGDSLREEPFLISYLVRLACVHIGVQAIWEGLAEQRWSDPQLQELQTWLQRYDFLAAMKRPLEAEHAAGVLTAELIRQKGARYLFALGGPDSSELASGNVVRLWTWLFPSGWYYHEKVNYSRLFHRQQQALAATGGKARLAPGRIESGVREVDRELCESAGSNRRLRAIVNHRIVAALLLPALGRVSSRAAAAQTAVEQAAIACALERHRLAHGTYPLTIDALAPQFIATPPSDLLTGEPYKYRQTDGAGFILYSVGWNENDDGGKPGKTLFDDKQGDWVWLSKPSTSVQATP